MKSKFFVGSSRPGAEVKKGEGLLEVETDKVNVEIEAPADGV